MAKTPDHPLELRNKFLETVKNVGLKNACQLHGVKEGTGRTWVKRYSDGFNHSETYKQYLLYFVEHLRAVEKRHNPVSIVSQIFKTPEGTISKWNRARKIYQPRNYNDYPSGFWEERLSEAKELMEKYPDAYPYAHYAFEEIASKYPGMNKMHLYYQNKLHGSPVFVVDSPKPSELNISEEEKMIILNSLKMNGGKVRTVARQLEYPINIVQKIKDNYQK